MAAIPPFESKQKIPPLLAHKQKESDLSYFAPWLPTENWSDEKVQSSVKHIWLSIHDLLSNPQSQKARYTIFIPFRQGLLFKELLKKHPAIKKTIIGKENQFTIVFQNSLSKINKKTSCSTEPYEFDENDQFRTSSASNPERNIIQFSHQAPPDYLKKFLEISELMLCSIEERKKNFTIPALGFDRAFLKIALLDYYPTYIRSVLPEPAKYEQGTLYVSLLKEKHDLDALAKKIDKFKVLIQRANQSIPDIPLPPSNFSEDLDSSDRAQLVIAYLADAIRQDLRGEVPKTIESKEWEEIWHHVEENYPEKYTLNQQQIYDIVSSKHRLESTSWQPVEYLNEEQKTTGLSKVEQMQKISAVELIRGFYPEGVKNPIVDVRINGMPLIFEKGNSDDFFKNTKTYFRSLLTTLMHAQGRDGEENAKQLASNMFLLFKIGKDGATLQCEHSEDQLIISMLQASSFAFGANVYFTLTKKIFSNLEEYKIKLCPGEPTCEFFIDPSGDCSVIRTTSFTLFKEHAKKSVFVTKLISSFSKEKEEWSFQIKIPSFHLDRSCSLPEQKKIYAS